MPRLAPLLLILLLAACGQLPRPFQPEVKNRVDLHALSAQDTVLVLPMDGAPDTQSGARAADLLAQALVRRGVPASANASAPYGRLLAGRARVSPGAEGAWEEVSVDWRMVESDGALLAEHQQRFEIPVGAWRQDADLLGLLADDAAPALASALLGPTQPAGQGLSEARLVLLGLEGAPGDGGEALPDALGDELRALDIPLAGVAGERDLLLTGEVTLTPAPGGRQQVTFTWRVLRAADGSEVDRISQSNSIPAGSLDGRWGATARLVARGTAVGVQDLLQQASQLSARR